MTARTKELVSDHYVNENLFDITLSPTKAKEVKEEHIRRTKIWSKVNKYEE